MRASILCCAALALASCSEEANESDPENGAVAVPIEEAAAPAEPTGEQVAEAAEATPMAERVATIGLLNKRNNVSKDFEMKPGEVIEEGRVTLRLEACERTAPYEFPQETGAFVQVDVLERNQTVPTRVFSGWLFKENPSLNVVEHPVYDVWVKDCVMSFPGDE